MTDTVTSIIPELLDALYDQSCELFKPGSGVTVSDGWDMSKGTGVRLMIGVDDFVSGSPTTAGESDQAPATLGPNRSRDENGFVTCAVYASFGDKRQKRSRDAAYAAVNLLGQHIRANPNLNIRPGGNLVVGFGSSNMSQAPTDKGRDCLWIFTITFFARL